MGSDPENYWQDRIDESNLIDKGDTNKIYLTDEGTLIKVFQDHSLPVIVRTVGYLLAGRWSRMGAEDRIRREVKIRDLMEELDVQYPRIIRREGKYVEIDYIDGETVDDILEADPDRAESLGEEIGAALKKVHGEDVAFGDLSLGNIMIENEEMYFLEFEFGEVEADYFDRFVDQMTLLMDLRTMEKQVYSGFRDGFESVNRFYLSSRIVSVFYALGLSILLRRSPRRVYNAFRSLF